MVKQLTDKQRREAGLRKKRAEQTQRGAPLRRIVAERLRQWMAETGTNGQQLSRVLGVSQGFISKVAAGKVGLSIDSLALLSKKLGVDATWLLGGSDERHDSRTFPHHHDAVPYPIKKGRPVHPLEGENIAPSTVDTASALIEAAGGPMALLRLILKEKNQ